MKDLSELLSLEFEPNYKRYPGRILECKEMPSEIHDDNESILIRRFHFYYGKSRAGGSRASILEFPNRLFLWDLFYPLDDFVLDGRKGLGTLAHVQVLDNLRKVSSAEQYLIMHLNASSRRKNHLRAMNLNLTEQFPEYFRKSVQYALDKKIIVLKKDQSAKKQT